MNERQIRMVADNLWDGQIIKAVKLVKDIQDCGLKEAKDIVDAARFQAGMLDQWQVNNNRLAVSGRFARYPSSREGLVTALKSLIDAHFGTGEPEQTTEEKLDMLADRIADLVWEKLTVKLAEMERGLAPRGSYTTAGGTPPHTHNIAP